MTDEINNENQNYVWDEVCDCAIRLETDGISADEIFTVMNDFLAVAVATISSDETAARSLLESASARQIEVMKEWFQFNAPGVATHQPPQSIN